jgi:hypothetical protein
MTGTPNIAVVLLGALAVSLMTDVRNLACYVLRSLAVIGITGA